MKCCASLFLLAASSTISSQCLGFTLLGGTIATKGWKNPTVELHVNPTNCPDNVRDLLEKAMDVWNGVPSSSLELKLGSDSATTIEQVLAGTIDVTPSVHCVTDLSAIGLNANVIPGVATGQAYDQKGYLITGALILNVQPGAAANINRLDSELTIDVMTHELGHVLGLGHSAEDSALMYYDASSRKSPTLGQDDVDGITYLYARDELGADPVLGGCAVIGSRHHDPISWMMVIVLAIPVFFGVAGARMRVRGENAR